MCGIVGILSRSSSTPDASALVRMNNCQAHRGPDDSGTFIQGPIALGHRRLSILDLSNAGHQPMPTPNGRFTITFNGEIYNFKELRDQYLSDTTLHSTSDTEVLLHLLAKQGVDALPRLRGMFAFALWDAKEETLLLARDPFGKKPLYYAETPEAFIFASEIKALLAYRPELKQLDPVALTKYFLYEYVPAPATGYREIKQLRMGEYMWLDLQTPTPAIGVHSPFVRGSKTFSPPYEGGVSPSGEGVVSERQVLNQLDKLLHQSVARRLVADVPVGILLSGGLDSSAIAWYTRQITKAPLHTFSVSFGEQSFDESSYAKQIAEQLGTIHHDLKFGLEELHQALKEVLPLLDIPFADASLLPTYAICKLARQPVKVVLDGDGSDELFGGYGTFQAARLAESLPPWLRQLLIAATPSINKLPPSHNYFSLDFKLKSFLKGLPYPFAARNQVWLGSFSGKELQELLKPEWRENIEHLFEDVLPLLTKEGTRQNGGGVVSNMPSNPHPGPLPFQGEGVTHKTSLLTIAQYLHNDILVKLDRASMYASLEARTPFLDVDLAEFALALPEKFRQNKYILKKLMRGRIPDAIIDRPKQGFALPLAQWLAGPLYNWAANILNTEKIAAQGILEPAVVTHLLAEHKSRRADHRKKLWTLIMFQLWREKIKERES